MRLFSALLVALAIAPQAASAASVTVSGPTGEVLRGTGVLISAQANHSGCNPTGFKFLHFQIAQPGGGGFYPVYGTPIGSTTSISYGMLTPVLGIYQYRARFYCVAAGGGATGIETFSATRSVKSVSQLSAPPVVPKKPVAKAKPKPKRKAKPKPNKKRKVGNKEARKRKLAALKSLRGLAKRNVKLAKQGKKAEKKKSFGDWLQDVKKWFEAKKKVQKQVKKAFGGKPKKNDLSQFKSKAAKGFRGAQLAAIPNFTKQLEKLGDFRNVAVRAALAAEQSNPEVKKQLDIAAGLYKGDYFATFDSLTAKEKGDVATQFGVMVQTGAAKRLVNEMAEAGKSASNVAFAN